MYVYKKTPQGTLSCLLSLIPFIWTLVQSLTPFTCSPQNMISQFPDLEGTETANLNISQRNIWSVFISSVIYIYIYICFQSHLRELIGIMLHSHCHTNSCVAAGFFAFFLYCYPLFPGSSGQDSSISSFTKKKKKQKGNSIL